MQIKSFFKTMSDGAEVWTNRWMPDEDVKIKGIVELHHGLAEHSMRYDRLGTIFAENGYIFNAYDFRGHGRTAENAKSKNKGDFGILADKDGFNRCVEDLNEQIEGLKSEFPGVPVILLGHSFGSFVSQGYIEKYSDKITGCILCGTAGPRKLLVGSGKIVVDILKFFRGAKTVSPFVIKLAFGSYNNHIKNPKTSNDWLSKNQDNVHIYEMDQWCGFPLPIGFFADMMSGLKQIHKSSNIKKISNDLPIYFIYGSEDPVGDYGKTINKLYAIYQKNGVKNLEIKAYDTLRHELFNEEEKETIEKDVLTWIEKTIR